jgi:hypothetical protein
MAAQSQRIDGSPTILWIAWKVGEVKQEQPLCLLCRCRHKRHYADLRIMPIPSCLSARVHLFSALVARSELSQSA